MAGRSPAELEDWTWGEILMLAKSWQKAQRQHYQALSVIGWESAVLTARALAGEQIQPVYVCYPFWDEQEQKQLRLEGYRAMMQRLAGGGEVKHE
jgi:hypothetical protein